MTSITSLSADRRFHHVRASADSLSTRSDRVNAHIEIAKDDPQHDFSWAKICARRGVVTRFDLFGQRECLQAIVAAEACFSLAEAKVTAGSIDDPVDRELAYLDIIQIEAQTDIEAAKITMLANIKDLTRRACANKYISTSLAKSGSLAGAEMTADSITDDFHRQEALSKIRPQQET